jgi:hypothetical protein
MTDYNQLGGYPMPGGDIAVKNATGTAIGANLGVLIYPGDGTLCVRLPSNSNTATLGITTEIIPAGKTGLVRIAGVAVAIAGTGNVTAGTSVMLDYASSHIGYVKATGSGDTQVGRALTSGSDGDYCLVQVNVAKNA